MTKDNFRQIPNCPRSLTDFFTNWDCILHYDKKGVHLTIPLTGTHPKYVFKRARGRVNDV
jgi:hypothetical protein